MKPKPLSAFHSFTVPTMRGPPIPCAAGGGGAPFMAQGGGAPCIPSHECIGTIAGAIGPAGAGGPGAMGGGALTISEHAWISAHSGAACSQTGPDDSTASLRQRWRCETGKQLGSDLLLDFRRRKEKSH